MPFQYPASEACFVCARFDQHEPWRAVMEDASVVVFVPDRQRVPFSLLLVPRRHIRSYLELTDDEIESLAQLTQESARLINQAADPEGMNIWSDIGLLAGQAFAHMCFEIVPRFSAVSFEFGKRALLPFIPAEEQTRQLEIFATLPIANQ
jgi:diadenosine tetraphosphate (Ap4A) HIT family hydrolase